ncbi:MAG: histone deacetylase [Candidatus Latescibacterota bacterium]
MQILYNSVFLQHDTGLHPENRKRLETCGDLQESTIENGEQYLPLFHTQNYVDRVKEASREGLHLDVDTVASAGSYEAAIYAVGATVMASRTGDFALVRPPGHHAYPSRSSGFCLFNNIAIAAQKLVLEGKSVLILDIDGHLGDGTFHFFYPSDQVLYCSLHQSPAFPGGGAAGEIGTGQGKGFTINIPLPPGSGDDIYMRALQKVLPIAEQFDPDVVAVSAGFDAHQYDLLLDLRLSATTYYHLGRFLRSSFENIFATLEGGYNIQVFPKCLFNFIDGINGEEMRFEEQRTDSRILAIEEFELRMSELNSALSPFWTL